MTETFDCFLAVYNPDYKNSESNFDESSRLFGVNGAAELFRDFSGCTFGGGIYRLFFLDEFDKWDRLVLDIFSQYQGRISCFGSDWMGRIYAWDYGRNKAVILDPGFGEALKIPRDFYELHNHEFVDYPDESLSKNLYDEYLDKFKTKVQRDQCAGYKISPFLGGKDNLENLELSDLEVYWSICSDIYNQVENT